MSENEPIPARLSELHPPAGSRHRKVRVGRGMGSKLGKNSGKGNKGGTSRSGFRLRRGFEGGQMPLHRRLPKRGFTNIFRTEYTVVNLDRIAEMVETGGAAELTLEVFAASGLLRKRNGLVKVLGDGDLSAAVTVHAHKFSKTAQEKIEKAGGKAILIA